MLNCKPVIWVIAALTAVALSATTILAAPQLPFNEHRGSSSSRPSLEVTKPMVGQMASKLVEATATPVDDEIDDNDDLDENEDLDDDDDVLDENEDLDDDDEDDLDENEDLDGSQEDRTTGVGEGKIIAAIADQYALSPSDVEALRAEYNLGYGEIQRLLRLALAAIDDDAESETDADPDEAFADAVDLLIDARVSRTGWGSLAKELGLKPGCHGDNLGSIVSGHTSPITDVTGIVTGTASNSDELTQKPKEKNRVEKKDKGDRNDARGEGSGRGPKKD